MGSARQSGNSNPPKHAVVCLTKYIPYPGIAHAGGEYLLEHVRVLEPEAHIELMAPPTPLNREAFTRVDAHTSATLLEHVRPTLHGLLFRFFQVEATLAGSTIYWPIRRLFRSDRAPWQTLAGADLIELQWSEMIALAPAIRRRLPHATLVGVAHDVSTQRWSRGEALARPWVKKLLAGFVARRTRKREAISFAALDCLIVFSEKDAKLARELAPRTRVEVIHPGFTPKTTNRTADPNTPVALFVGAMSRPENEEAVLWFLSEIWPTVQEQIPAAKFVIAGAKPSRRVQEAAGADQSIELTGFVESLEPWYQSATVGVIPLRSGAGVKFKTIDAMLAGVPVVTTSIGAEGIDAGNLFVAQTDDPTLFAQAIVDVLLNPDQAAAQQARLWAESVYGLARFRTHIQNLYEGLLHD